MRSNTAKRRADRVVATGRYALAWLLGVAVLCAAAAIGLGALSRTPPPARPADPVARAAERGACLLRRDAGGTTGAELDVMQPPTIGPRATPAAAGIYSKAPRTTAVVGSLRKGIVVVQYRRGTPRTTVLRLRRLLAHAPFESIVTPDATGMRYAVAATAWGRLLGCPRVSRPALEAVSTFASAYRGHGPDARR